MTGFKEAEPTDGEIEHMQFIALTLLNESEKMFEQKTHRQAPYMRAILLQELTRLLLVAEGAEYTKRLLLDGVNDLIAESST